MSYFADFPTIQYDINKSGHNVELTNILRGVKIRSELKENAALYIRYDYRDTDRPEYISNTLYDDPEFHWIVMHMNDVVDPYYDLPISEFALNKYTESKYPGQTFFLNADTGSSSSSSGSSGYTTISGSYQTDERVRSETVEYSGKVDGGSLNHVKLPSGASSVNDFYNNAVIRFVSGTGSGQTAIIADYNATTRVATFVSPISTQLGCDTNFEIYSSGTVHRWDPTYSRLEVKNIFGTFSETDKIIGVTSKTESILQKKVVESKFAVHHFEDVSTREWLNPRDSSINYIGGYIMNTNNSVVEAAVVTNTEYEQRENDDKRFVSLMDPDVVQLAISDFEDAMNTRRFG